MPHDRLQEFVIIDYTKQMVILAVVKEEGEEEKEKIIGIGQYYVDEVTHTADVAFAVRDVCQGKGMGTELLSYLTYLAKKQSLLGFTAEVLMDNKPMLRVFEKAGFNVEKSSAEGIYELKMLFWKGLWPVLLRRVLGGS